MWIAVVVLAVLYVVLAVRWRRASRRLHVQAAASEYAALHDHVTELPNRVLFHDRVHQAAKRAARDGCGAAVLMIDLDRFKEINDTLGHHNGDLLLCTVGAAPDRDAARRRFRRAPRRRRVRRPARRRLRDRGRARRGGAHPPRDLRAARARGPRHRGRGERRHRALPRARRGPRDAAPARRRRDVHGQARSQRRRGLRRRSRPVQPREPRADRRPAPRDRRRPARPALPAQGRSAHRR